MDEKRIDLTCTAFIFHEKRLLLIHHNKLNRWLPVGGHIEENETPDETILREVKEETGIDVELIDVPKIPPEHPTKKVLAVPFYVDLHNVGDHDHVGFCYLCNPLNPEKLEINKNEVGDFKWIKKEDFKDNSIPKNVQCVAKMAFDLMENNGSF